MKRIISFVLCLSMLLSCVPVNVFGAELEESIPATEAILETELPTTEALESEPEIRETEGTTAPSAETAEAAVPAATAEVTEPVEETEAPHQAVTEAAAETEPVQTEPLLAEPVMETSEEVFISVEDLLPEGDELFAGYVDKVFYGTSTYGTAAGSRLTGDTRVAYEGFRELVAQIAAGEGSSGVLTVNTGFSGQGLPEKLLTDVVFSLLADMPYEMYWFDKTKGVGGSYTTLGGNLRSVTLEFCVSPDYSVTGNAKTYDIDTEKTSAASAAAANAQAIVDEYADSSDYEKLVAYRDEICALTSYNKQAVSGSYTGGYGDPWQLIYVFDGKDSTRVVCEGYSKAFQYLCDLSAFDADITCYNVQGYLSGGGHMWNIVSIRGRNYLVDVTNSEAGYFGYKDKLFLVGAAPNADGSYTFEREIFSYGKEAIDLWGTGEGSILNLATSNFEPDSLTTMTGEELLSAMEAAEYGYGLTRPVVIDSAVTLPAGTSLIVREGASITVADGGELTTSCSISFYDGADFTVSSGGTWINRTNLTLHNGSTIAVEAGGILTNYSNLTIHDGCAVRVAGILSNNSGIHVQGGTLAVTGIYEHSFSGRINVGTPDTVSGIASSEMTLDMVVDTEEELIYAAGIIDDYASVSYIRLENQDSDEDGEYEPITLTRSLEIPDNALIQIGYSSGHRAELILAKDVTLTIQNYLNLAGDYAFLTVTEGATLVNNGTVSNGGTIIVNGTFANNGTLEGNPIRTQMTQTALETALAQCGGQYVLTDSVTISSDMTIPEVRLEVEGGKLIVKEGVTLTNRGGMVIRGGGAVIVNGTLENIGWYLDVEKSGSLTVNGTLAGNDIQIYGGSLVNNGTLDIEQVNVGLLTLDEITLTGVPQEKINYAASVTTTDELIAALALVEQYNPWIGIQQDLTLTKDVTVPAGANVAFENATLTVASGATLTLNGEFFVNPNCHLIVAQGGKLVSNVNLNITNHSRHENGAVVTVNGELISKGGIWLTDGGSLNVNGSAVVYGPFHAGFGNGQMCPVNVSGSLTTYGYMNLVSGTSRVNIAQGGTMTVGEKLFDDSGEPYANGFLQAGGEINVDGTLNVRGGLTLAGHPEFTATLNVSDTGAVTVAQDNMWFDVYEYGRITNYGSFTNHACINLHGEIANHAAFTNHGQLRTFGSGSYQNYAQGTLNGNAPMEGTAAQYDDFMNDLTDGGGVDLSRSTVTLKENLTVNLGENHMVIRDGATLIIPAGVTMTVNSHVAVNEGAIQVLEGGKLILNTNLDVISQGALGCIGVEGQMVINDGGTLWLDQGGSLEITPTGVVDVKENHATEPVAAIHVSYFSDGGTVLVEGTLNTGGYVNVTPGGWFSLRKDGTLNIKNNAEYGCGYLDVTGMAQLYGTVNQDGLLSSSNGNGTADFVPNTARIEVYGTLNASDTSAITINPNASISVAPSGVLTTAGEVKVEQFGTLWVDGDVTFSGPAPVTSYGNIHVNHFLDDADYNGCLIIDGTVTNYGYMNIGQSGTLYVNGTLDISQTVVEDQGFAGYLNSFGYVIVNGTVNNSAFMDTDSPDGSGYLRINQGGTVNVKDNIVMSVCDKGKLIVDGTLNMLAGSYMEVYNDISGSGNWNNSGVVHFGVYTETLEKGTTETSVGSCSFTGTYVHGQYAEVEVEWYQGEPIAFDLVDAYEQTLIYSGSNAEEIVAVLEIDYYYPDIEITGDVTIDEYWYEDFYGILTVAEGATLTLENDLYSWGEIIVFGTLINNGSLDNDGSIRVEEGATLINNGSLYNTREGALAVLGTFINNGQVEGTEPSSIRTGKELADALAASEDGYYWLHVPITVTGQVTLPEDTHLNISTGGSITVEENAHLICNSGVTIDVDGCLTVKEKGHITIEQNFSVGEYGTMTVDGTLTNRVSIVVDGALNVNGTYEQYGAMASIKQNWPGVIRGVDTQLITLDMKVDSKEAFLDAVSLADEYETVSIRAIPTRYADEGISLYITLDQDLVIPENVYLRIGGSVQLTLSDGVTLTNNGTLELQASDAILHIRENAVLENNGRFENFYDGIFILDGTMINNGEAYRGTTVDTAEELLAALEEAPLYDGAYIDVYSNDDSAVTITLTEDLTIPKNTMLSIWCWEDAPVKLILTNGATLTNNNVISVGEYATIHIQETAAVVNNSLFQLEYGSLLILDGTWSGNYPQAAPGTITGTNAGLNIGIETTIQPSFYEHFFDGNTENYQEPGLFAGAKTAFRPILTRLVTGEVLDASAVSVSVSEGAEQYAKIVQKNGLITVTANSNLTTREDITFTFTAENASPAIHKLTLLPKATEVDVLLDGEIVTNQTILADLNRGDSGFQLSHAVCPASAVPEDGIKSNMRGFVTWSSSDPAIASVLGDGSVFFTGDKTGKVKITMTADYGVKKTAVVTFDVVALPQSIASAPANGRNLTLVGGSGATYTVVDQAGTALNASAVKWYLCDEQGEAIAAHPYATLTSAGRLATKAVPAVNHIYLMAQVIGDEQSAKLEEPLCVTVYPAIESVQILDVLGDPINNKTLLYDNSTQGLTYQLGWDVAPCAEAVQSLSWTSSNTDIAAINADGLITLASENAAGTVEFTLTVTALNGRKISGTFSMKFGVFTTDLILEATLADGTPIQNPTNLEVISGDTVTFSGSCLPVNKRILWEVSDKACGSVSSSGVLKTKNVVNPATFKVIAKSEDGTRTEEIEILLLPKPVSTPMGPMDPMLIRNDEGYVTKTTQTMAPGSEMQLYGDSQLYSSRQVEWKSSAPAIADVNANGTVTALKKGTATITATATDGSNRTANFKVKVDKVSVKAEITTKKGDPFTVASGKSLDLMATVIYTDNSVDNKATWTVDNTALAKISGSGKLTATKGLTVPTTVRVTATAKDGKATASVNVQILPLTTTVEIYGPFGSNGSEINLTNTSHVWDMLDGKTIDLSAVTYPADAMDAVTWTSSSTKVAEIDGHGTITCKSSGTVTITATAKDGSGKKASFKLTVMKTMEYLRLPEIAFVGGGKSLTFSKLAGYAVDPLATNQNLRWILTDEHGNPVPKSVATLSDKGVLTTKPVTAVVELLVRAESTDGSKLHFECSVGIFPVIKGVDLYNENEILITKQTVSTPVNKAYTVLPDATNVPGFGCEDDGTADEIFCEEDYNASYAWTVTLSNPALATVEYDGGKILICGKEEAAGKSVKVTVKANDGSNKSAFFTLKFT